MKIFLLSLWLAIAAPAAPLPIDLVCVTEWPTTSFVIQEEGEKLRVELLFHSGSEYAPAITGIYTPRDLPIITERANYALVFPNYSVFRWPLAKCDKHDDPLRFECFGTDDVQNGNGGERIKPFALYTTKVSEDGIAGKLDYLKVAFTYQVNGKGDPSLEMTYDRAACIRSSSVPPAKYWRAFAAVQEMRARRGGR